jgi:hypothetical protein
LVEDQEPPHSEQQTYAKEEDRQKMQSDQNLSDSNRNGILKENTHTGSAIKSESSKKSITWRNQVQEEGEAAQKQPSPVKQA